MPQPSSGLHTHFQTCSGHLSQNICQSVFSSMLTSCHQAGRHQNIKKAHALSLRELAGEIGMETLHYVLWLGHMQGIRELRKPGKEVGWQLAKVY